MSQSVAFRLNDDSVTGNKAYSDLFHGVCAGACTLSSLCRLRNEFETTSRIHTSTERQRMNRVSWPCCGSLKANSESALAGASVHEDVQVNHENHQAQDECHPDIRCGDEHAFAGLPSGHPFPDQKDHMAAIQNRNR